MRDALDGRGQHDERRDAHGRGDPDALVLGVEAHGVLGPGLGRAGGPSASKIQYKVRGA